MAIPPRQDWGESVHKDIEDFKLNLTLNQIEKMSQPEFQNLVKKKEKINTLKYRNSVKAKHYTVLDISHSSLEMSDYLKPNGITNTEASG